MSWTPPLPRTGHPYYMHDAIYAQPGALRLVGRENGATLDALAARVRDMDRVVLAGIGTSWHAALAGELLLARGGKLGHRVRALHSFELTGYWPDVDARTAVIVVTHRGSKRFSREALEKAHASAGIGVVITGKGHDNLPMAHETLRTVDQESSAAHTVSYTTALALLAGLAARVGNDGALRHALGEVPDQLAFLLGQESWEELAARYADRRRYWFVGGGPNTATALEAALKMSEANHADAIGYNVEQFLHGPWAAFEAEDVLVVVAPPGPCHERCLMAARTARQIGAPVIALAREDDREMAAVAQDVIALPETEELISPILAVVPLQLFTYHLALVRGVTPDTMRTDRGAHAEAFRQMAL